MSTHKVDSRCKHSTSWAICLACYNSVTRERDELRGALADLMHRVGSVWERHANVNEAKMRERVMRNARAALAKHGGQS